jgi:hypothetical protein
MKIFELAQRERLQQEPPWIGARRILPTQSTDCFVHNFLVVEGQFLLLVAHIGDRNKEHTLRNVQSGRQVLLRYDIHVADGQHPTSGVTGWGVEHLKLSRSKPNDPGLVAQGTKYSVRETFTLMQEGAGESPGDVIVGLASGEEDAQSSPRTVTRLGHGQHGGVDSERRAGVVLQRLALCVPPGGIVSGAHRGTLAHSRSNMIRSILRQSMAPSLRLPSRRPVVPGRTGIPVLWELRPVKGCEGRLPSAPTKERKRKMTITDSVGAGGSVQDEGAAGPDDSDLGPGFEDFEGLNNQAVRFRLLSALGHLGLGLLQEEWIETTDKDGNVSISFTEPIHALTRRVLPPVRTALQALIVLNARSDNWIGDPDLGNRMNGSAEDVDYMDLTWRLFTFASKADDHCQCCRNLEPGGDSEVVSFLTSCFASKAAFDEWARAQIEIIDAHARRLNPSPHR